MEGKFWTDGRVEDKIHPVKDEVCWGCRQNYDNSCRAFSIPHSRAESIYRELDEKVKCYNNYRSVKN